MMQLSIQKFSSNVVEKLFCSGPSNRQSENLRLDNYAKACDLMQAGGCSRMEGLFFRDLFDLFW